MSLTDELLDSLTDEEIAAYTADYETEPHIVISNDRYITVPEQLKRIAVQYDHDIETVIFDCPRYWDGLDMSKMKIYINYMRQDKVRGSKLAENITIDEIDNSIMHFEWTVSNNVTLVAGKLSFLICIKKTDSSGQEINHWNSELCRDVFISEGLECGEPIISQYPDIITDLLTRMDYVESVATPENMQEYVDSYFASDEADELLKQYIYDYLSELEPTSEEAMQGYVESYLDKNPPLLSIGPEKPGVRSLWFDTKKNGEDDGSETEENTVLKMTGNTEESVYAEIDGETVKYNIVID